MLGRNSTPAEVAVVAAKFVDTFNNGTAADAYTALRTLQIYMDALYWPSEDRASDPTGAGT